MSRVFQMLARRGVGEFQVVLSMLSKNAIHRSLRAGRWLVTWAPLLKKKNLDNRLRSSTLRVTSGVKYFKILAHGWLLIGYYPMPEQPGSSAWLAGEATS